MRPSIAMDVFIMCCADLRLREVSRFQMEL